MCNSTPRHPRAHNLSGEKFGRWFVIDFSRMKNQRTYWLCRCNCGTEREVRQDILLNGTSTSCGCFQREFAQNQQTIHGMTNTPEYRCWRSMITRCTNPNSQQYHNYGNRGIKICDRWRNSFSNFLEDMGNRPARNYSLDRIDNNGNYEPNNCRWATSKEQCRNTRYNVAITFRGKTKKLCDWADELGISGQSLRYRIDNWTLEEAFTLPITPPQKRRRRK